MNVNLAYAPMDLGATTRRCIAEYTGPNPYVTGGDPVDPQDLRLGKLFAIAGQVAVTPGGAVYLLALNGPAGGAQKILWIDAITGVEVANGTNLSTAAAQVEFIGQ